jgi:hypothetical protein
MGYQILLNYLRSTLVEIGGVDDGLLFDSGIENLLIPLSEL